MNQIANKIWVLDGYVAVGKSTTLKNVKSLLNKQIPNLKVHTYEENVGEWENYHGVNMLRKMYETEGGKWKSRFQHKAILDIQRQDTEIRKNSEETLSIQERDLLAIKKVFLPQLEPSLERIDYHLLLEQTEIGLSEYESALRKKRIFLYGDIEHMYARMQKRGRKAEQGISREKYAEMCLQMDCMRERSEYVINCTGLAPWQVARAVVGIITGVRG